MSDRNGNKLFDANGKQIPINQGPVGVTILKVQRGHNPSQQLLQSISVITHANVLVIPFEYEIMSGEVAIEELHTIHNAIHAILKANKEQSDSERKN